MKTSVQNPVAAILFALLISVLCLALPVGYSEAKAGDSAEAFMSATFGLSAARTQKRMENSGAAATDFVRAGRLSMSGVFESRSALFVFGFHNKKGLNYKAVYIASTGNAKEDRAFYDALREAYCARFGKTEERVISNVHAKGKIAFLSVWKPNQYTTISLSCNPEVVSRFPGNSPGDRPVHLIYSYTKWSS